MKPYIRTLAIVLLTLASMSSRAEDLTVSDISIASYGQSYASICLDNTDSYTKVSFLLQLPTGFSFADIGGSDPVFSLGPDVHTTERTTEHDIEIEYIDDNDYFITIISDNNELITGNEGPIATFGLWASDVVLCGEHEVVLHDIVLTKPDESQVELPDTKFCCHSNVMVRMGSSGFASFSWPTAVDFSETGVNAYISRSVEDGYMKLEKVTKVPAHTGVILQGTEGTYSLQTLPSDDDCDDVSGNLLRASDESATLVTFDGYYALTQRDYVGFFRVEEGVFIPRHKCYYLDMSGWMGNSFCFDTTDGIRKQDVNPVHEGPVYNLCGMQVDHPQKRGIYIINGKKIIYQ